MFMPVCWAVPTTWFDLVPPPVEHKAFNAVLPICSRLGIPEPVLLCPRHAEGLELSILAPLPFSVHGGPLPDGLDLSVLGPLPDHGDGLDLSVLGPLPDHGGGLDLSVLGPLPGHGGGLDLSVLCPVPRTQGWSWSQCTVSCPRRTCRWSWA